MGHTPVNQADRADEHERAEHETGLVRVLCRLPCIAKGADHQQAKGETADPAKFNEGL